MRLCRDSFSWLDVKSPQYRCYDCYFGFIIKMYVHVLLKMFVRQHYSDAFLISHHRYTKSITITQLSDDCKNYKADVAKSNSPSELQGVLSYKEVQRREKKRTTFKDKS